MNDGTSELAARIEKLDERMTRLEGYLGLGAARGTQPVHEPQPKLSPSSGVAPEVPVDRRPVQLDRTNSKGAALERVSTPSESAPVAPLRQRVTANIVQREWGGDSEQSTFSIEKIIGARLFAGVGALAIVIGVGLFLKFAYDQGWMGRVPPLGKCVAAGVFGFVLLCAGEWARRRINAMASAGLSAAGVGALYATAFAAYAQWGLVSTPGAMALLVGACVIGLGVGARAGLASVAGLALVGGYMAPMVIGAKAAAAPAFMPAYLAALFVVGLALSGWIGRTNRAFHKLRYVCWLGTGGLGTLWLLMTGIHDHTGLALVFIGGVWALTHAERVASLRGLWSVSEAERSDEESATISATPFSEGRAILGSFSATTWAAGFGAWALQSGLHAPSWIAPAALFGPTTFLGFVLAGHLRALRDAPRTEGERFGVGMLAQSGALALAMIAMALSGWTQVIAWLALGLAAICAGRWMRSTALDWYGLLALTFATVRLGLLIPLGVSAAGAGQLYWGVYIDVNSLRVALTALAWLFAAGLLLVHEGSARPVRAVIAAHVGLWLIALIPMREETLAGSACIAWLALASGAFAAGHLSARLKTAVSGIVLLGLSIIAWVIAFPGEDWNSFAQPVGLHPGLWVALLIGGVGLAAARWACPPEVGEGNRKIFMAWSMAGALAMLFVASSFEVARGATEWAAQERARQAAVSIYWGLFAVALLVAGFIRSIPAVRYVGLGLMGVAAAKAVLVDLSAAPPAWRIASFMGLGLLMVGVALAYARIAASLEAEIRSGEDEPSSENPDVASATEAGREL